MIGFGSSYRILTLQQREADRQRQRDIAVARQAIIAEVLINQHVIANDRLWVEDKNYPQDLAPVERAAIYPLPRPVMSAWESQLPLVPLAFSAFEVILLQQFYAFSAAMYELRMAMQALHLNQGSGYSLSKAWETYQRYSEWMEEFELPVSMHDDANRYRSARAPAFSGGSKDAANGGSERPS